MRKIPTKRGQIDPEKMTLQENMARLPVMFAALKKSLEAGLLHASCEALTAIRETSWAMYQDLLRQEKDARQSETALTLARKDTA